MIIVIAFFLGGIYLLLFVLLKKLVKYLIISPIYVYTIFNFLNIVLSILYFFCFTNKFSLANVDDISTKDFWTIINYYLFSNIAFILGVILNYCISRRSDKRRLRYNLNNYMFSSYKLPKYIFRLVLTITIFITTLYVIGYGGGLIYRTSYIPNIEGKALVSIAKVLSMILALLLGLYYKENKFISIILITTILLLTLATGSRVTVVIMVLFFLALFQSSRNTVINQLRFLIHLIFSFVFLSYVMQLRRLEAHGLHPYLAVLVNDSGLDLVNSIAFNVYYTFIFGVFASFATILQGGENLNVILISLNPLPGFIAGWQEIVGDLRLTRFMPFTMHGQVFKSGLIFTFVFFFVVGVIFSFFEKVIRKLLMSGNKRIAIVFCLLLSLFVFYGFEYHLRSAFRYIYYALFIYMIYRFFGRFTFRFKSSNYISND